MSSMAPRLWDGIGTPAGFAGPFLIGYINDRTGSLALGLLPLIGFAFVARMTVLLLGRSRVAQAMPAE